MKEKENAETDTGKKIDAKADTINVNAFKHIHNPEELWLLSKILDNFKVDVSYLNEEQYKNCLNMKFNGEKQSRVAVNYRYNFGLELE